MWSAEDLAALRDVVAAAGLVVQRDHCDRLLSCIDAIKRILKRYENEFGGGAATKH